jgi:hypothetical protein
MPRPTKRLGLYQESAGVEVVIRAEVPVFGRDVGDEFSVMPSPVIRHLLNTGRITLVSGPDPRVREMIATGDE